MALTAEDKKRLSKEDQDRINAYTNAWEQAKASGDKTAMDNAAAGAKSVREGSGYTNNLDGSYKASTNTNAYKNEAWAKGYGDEVQRAVGNTGNTVAYSQQKADSRNATAFVPGVGNVRVSIINGKTQDTGLPVGTIITPDGSNQSWQINGATANGYTSDPYTGSIPQSPNVSSGSYYNDLPNSYNSYGNSAGNIYQQMYDQQLKAMQEAQRQAEEAQRLAVERGVNTLNAQKAGINQQTDAALNQAYINDQLGNRNLAQYMKAQGMTGGLSESSMLDKRAAYENVLNDTRLAGNNALNQVDTDISNLKTTGDLNIANNASEYGLRLVDLLGSNLDKQVAQMNADRAYNYQVGRDGVMDDRYNQQWNYNVGRDQVSDNRYNQEWNYNIDRDKINDDRYNQEWQNQLKQQAYSNALKAANNSSTTTKPKTYNKTQYDNALNAYKGGDRSQMVIDIIESYGGLPVDTVFPKTNYEFTPNTTLKEANPFNNETVNRLLGLDTSLPFPNPKNSDEVIRNALEMQNRGKGMADIIAYGRNYGVDLSD